MSKDEESPPSDETTPGAAADSEETTQDSDEIIRGTFADQRSWHSNVAFVDVGTPEPGGLPPPAEPSSESVDVEPPVRPTEPASASPDSPNE
jgi:hypothetical protein